MTSFADEPAAAAGCNPGFGALSCRVWESPGPAAAMRQSPSLMTLSVQRLASLSADEPLGLSGPLDPLRCLSFAVQGELCQLSIEKQTKAKD